jgi:acyl dehydratase
LQIIASIDFHEELVTQGSVEAYLERHGRPIEATSIFDEGGYAMLSEPVVVYAPAENVTYSVASGDFNPIHSNPYIADFASLPDTITHGMWTAAYARGYVKSVSQTN